MLLKQCSLLGLFFRICALFQGQGYRLLQNQTAAPLHTRCCLAVLHHLSSHPHWYILVRTRFQSHSWLVDINNRVHSRTFPIAIVGFSKSVVKDITMQLQSPNYTWSQLRGIIIGVECKSI